MKKTLKLFVISILLFILLRGNIFRGVIRYVEIGNREETRITDKILIKKIQSETLNKEIDIHNIVKIADRITTRELAFTTRQSTTDPNQLIHSKEANCIGYSAMFNSIAHYLIRENGLEFRIEAKHNIGQLNLLGMDLHQYFKSPFFKDHDYNEIRDKTSNEIIIIDPILSDYLRIKRVAKQ